MNSRRGRFVCSALFLSLTAPLWACGPFFPDSVLDQTRAPLRAPIPSFKAEVRQIMAPSNPPPAAPYQTGLNNSPEVIDDTAAWAAELAELQYILGDLPGDRREAAINSYSYRRMPNPPPLSEDLPLDVRMYIEGARLYSEDKKLEAVAVWEKLLSLSPEERPNRSTWAAWMIARTIRDKDGLPAALPWYILCSHLSGEGFRDSLKLGLSSLGWQARYELEQGHYRSALELYYHQALAGDPYAWNSIKSATPAIEKLSPEQIAEFASDPFMRGLITAKLLNASFDWYGPTATSPENSDVARWLDAIETTKTSKIAEAARFAELAYSSANFDLAQRWLEKAPGDDPKAAWIRGKLALMYGRNEQAEVELTKAANAHPRSPEEAEAIYSGSSLNYYPAELLDNYRTSQLYGDLGAATLACDHYINALDAFYKGGFRTDAAYISERVLYPEELVDYTHRRFPSQTDSVTSMKDELTESARYLLARRLARLGRYVDASEFYPKETQLLLGYYLTQLSKQETFSITGNTRAAALWEAAQFHRTAGMDLFGTQLEPDNFQTGGMYPAPAYLLNRFGLRLSPLPEEFWYEVRDPYLQIIPNPSKEERSRILATRMPHEERYHYRYIAADLAWQASQYMPNNSAETARVLGIAGSWLQRRDPKAADRFYKAMIWRNWSTPLAREADAKRWFPEIPWKYDPYAAAGVERPSGYARW